MRATTLTSFETTSDFCICLRAPARFPFFVMIDRVRSNEQPRRASGRKRRAGWLCTNEKKREGGRSCAVYEELCCLCLPLCLLAGSFRVCAASSSFVRSRSVVDDCELTSTAFADVDVESLISLSFRNLFLTHTQVSRARIVCRKRAREYRRDAKRFISDLRD